MQSETATPISLSFAVSGQRGTGRSTLCTKLESPLRKAFPERKFEFIGRPFEHLPFPLLWDTREAERHATTRLLSCWAHMNEFSMRRLRSALERGAIPIMDGFGLDAYLYATACTDCLDENNEAFHLHHDGMVPARLKAQGIEPPHYIITQADPDIIDAWLVEFMPGVKDIEKSRRRAFIEYEESAIRRYFHNTGQKKPLYLNVCMPIDDQCDFVIAEIGKILKESELNTFGSHDFDVVSTRHQ